MDSSDAALKLLESVSQQRKDTELMFAVQEKNYVKVKFFIQGRANVNTVSVNLNTPLIWAACDGEIHIVDLLIKSNANVEMKNKFGYTALTGAIKNNQIPIVYLLFSMMSVEQLNDQLLDFPQIQFHFLNYKKLVTDHRINLFKIFGPLIFELNPKNPFSCFTPEIISIIAGEYAKVMQQAPWHAAQAEIDSVALYKGLDALLFSSSISNKNKIKCEQEEMQVEEKINFAVISKNRS